MDLAHLDAPKAGFHGSALTRVDVPARHRVAAAVVAVDASAHPTVVASDDEAEANPTLRALLASFVRYPVHLKVLYGNAESNTTVVVI